MNDILGGAGNTVNDLRWLTFVPGDQIKGDQHLSSAHSSYQLFFPYFFTFLALKGISSLYSEFCLALRGHQVLRKVSMPFPVWLASLELCSTGHKVYLWSLTTEEKKNY